MIPRVDALEERRLLSFIAEIEGNNSFASAQAVTVDTRDVLTATAAGDWLNLSGSMVTDADQDYFRFTLGAASGLFFDVDARETGLSDIDSVLTIFNSSQFQVGSNDDGYDFDTGAPAPASYSGDTPYYDSGLYLDLVAGTYFVRLTTLSSSGAYLLRMLADPNYSSTVPAFNSNAGAADTLYLDFDGHTAADTWRPTFPYTVLPYDFNGNGGQFSPGERLAMRNIWRTTSEDYSPFAINVTTVNPGSFNDGQAFRMALTMSDATAIGQPSGILGVAFLNSYAGSAVNTAFTFAGNFGYVGTDSSSRIVAQAVEQGNTASHEFGHALGLVHFTGTGQERGLMFTPDQGLSRETWFTGANENGAIQDDMAIISNTTNTFGYRADDHANIRTSATVLSATGGLFQAAGIISQLTDLDYFQFTTAAGLVTIGAIVDDFINNLDVELRLLNSIGTVLFTNDPSDSFDALISTTLAAGTYYVEIRSDGESGEAGQYNLNIVTAPTTDPDDQISEANSTSVGGTVSSFDIGTTNDVDMFAFTVAAGQTVTFDIDRPAGTLDSYIRLFNGSGTLLASNDNAAGPAPEPNGLESFLQYTFATAGTYYLGVSALGNTSYNAMTGDGDTVGGTTGAYTLILSNVPATITTIVDDGGAGFATTGTWSTASGQGYLNDVRYRAAGTGANTATWTFNVSPGTYRVSATWHPYSNRATNAPFTVLDGATALPTVALNQVLTPNDFSDAGVGWEDIGTFTVTGSTLTVRLTDAANGNVIADAVRIERISAPPLNQPPTIGSLSDSPDPVTSGNSVTLTAGSVADPDGTVASVAFYRESNGVAGLQTGGTGGDTSVGTDTSSAGGWAATVSTSGLSIGTYTYYARAADNQGATSNVVSTTSSVQATQPPSVQFIDDGGPGFATVGSWTVATGQGYLSDVRFNAGGSGADTATWTVAVTPGETYRVSVSWTAYSNRATDAPFTVLDGATALATVRLNQRLAPNDRTDAGTAWEDLGTFAIGSSTLVVRLTDAANGYVIADGVRIERVAAPVTSPEITVLDGSTSIPDGTGTVNFGSTTVGTPVTRTFTVRNDGTANLTLGAIGGMPAGFTLVAGFGASTLAPGATTSFQVRFDAATAGAASGQISFGNNDGDENPFNFTISATATAATASVQIIDDGGAGFATTGTWSTASGQGYLSDVRYRAAGTGANTATWTFNVSPGTYRVSATWHPYSNRATNAPFTVLDGATALSTVALNQVLTPNDFSDVGAGWEDIGTFTVTGSTLTVRLTDAANGNVIADAVRIEPVPDSGPQVSFVLNVTDGPNEGFNDPTLGAARRAAFQAALNIWSSILVASYAGETITIDASMDPLGGDAGGAILGMAGPSFLRYGPGLGDGNTWYGDALANHVLGFDDDPGFAEIVAQFNSDVDNGTVLGGTNWYYGTNGSPVGHIDFMTVVLHEIGHGLNFIDTINTDGSYFGGRPGVYDRFLENAAGTRLTALTNAGRASAIVSNNLYWGGAFGTSGNGGTRPRIYAPNPYAGGSSVSHLDEGVHGGELMSPFYSGVDHSPSPIEKGMYRDMGWTIAGTSDTFGSRSFDSSSRPGGTRQTIEGPRVPFSTEVRPARSNFGAGGWAGRRATRADLDELAVGLILAGPQNDPATLDSVDESGWLALLGGKDKKGRARKV